MRLINKTKGRVICSEIFPADTYLKRIFGLIGKKKFKTGLIFNKLNFGIHTFGMLEKIDVLLIDENKKVLKMKENLQPYRIFFYSESKVDLIELPSNSIKNSNTQIGDKVAIE